MASDEYQSPKDVAIAYFKAVDNGGDVLSLFADDAYAFFPKHAYARGIDQITELVGDVAPLWKSIEHAIAYFNFFEAGDTVIVEGSSRGEVKEEFGGGSWSETQGFGGRFCNVFEVKDGKIKRLHVHLDPDYAGEDTARYPWLNRAGA
ncbi:nuclear transport factor 2 family protein [Streptomyces sp. NPDC054919]